MNILDFTHGVGHFASEKGTISIEFIFILCVLFDFYLLLCRYNIMMSNIAESVNAMLDVEREFPIVTLFDYINRRFALLFHQRPMELVHSANRFVPSIEKDISEYVNAGNKLLAYQIANYKLSVTGHGDVATVDLQRRTCTCRIFYLDKIRCPHAKVALRSQHGVDFGIRFTGTPLHIIKWKNT